MHARLVTQDDELDLYVETRRLRAALGIRTQVVRVVLADDRAGLVRTRYIRRPALTNACDTAVRDGTRHCAFGPVVEQVGVARRASDESSICRGGGRGLPRSTPEVRLG